MQLWPSLGEDMRGRLLAAIDTCAASARRRLTARVADVRALLGPESRAWGQRLEAELLRLAQVRGERVPAGAIASAWATTVAGFEAFGHVPGAVHARVRLAQALAADGDDAEAGRVAAVAAPVVAQLKVLPMQQNLDVLLASSTWSEEPVRTTRGVSGSGPDLTPRELEVLALVAQGRTNGEIGKELFIATKTASVHVSNVLAKLGAATRGEAAAIARRDALLP